MSKKLILRVDNSTIKVYTEQMTFEAIEKFSIEHFKLKENGVQLTFEDDQGDTITVSTQEELSAMLEVFKEREYIKINVQGVNKKEEPQKTKTTKTSETQPETKIEAEPKEIKKKGKERSESHKKRREEKMKMREENKMERMERKTRKMEKKSGSRSNSKESSPSPRHRSQERDYSGDLQEDLRDMEKFLNGIVSKLVDQRVNSLLPCLKEKVLKGEDQIVPIQSDIVHTNIQCKGCGLMPIVGIRYLCQKCPNFNLCQGCESKIDHDHHLLKMKKVQENKEGDENLRLFKRCFENVFKQKRRRSHSHSHSRQRCHRRGGRGHHFMKKVWGLSIMYGGEPDTYKDFVETHQDLRPREIFKKWAQEHGISDEEFKKKFVSMKCQKLSKMFGKDPQVYQTFVSENIELCPRELMEALYEKGIEKREEKKSWWAHGRCFNFRDGPSSLKKEEVAEEVKEDQKPIVSPSMLKDPQPLDKPEVRRQKGRILQKMIEIFHEARKPEMTRHIDNNFSLGQEKIIDLWIKKICGP